MGIGSIRTTWSAPRASWPRLALGRANVAARKPWARRGRRIDPVPALELPGREPARRQPLDGRARELDRDHRVLAPVRDHHRQPATLGEVRLPPGTCGMKPEKARIPAGAGRAASSPVA